MPCKLRGGPGPKQELHHSSRPGKPGFRGYSDDSVTWAIFAHELHAPFGDEAAQQLVERPGDRRIRVNLERPVLLDQLDAVFLDVAGDDAGKRAAQVRGALVHRLVERQLEARHRLVVHDERLLESWRNPEQPV